MRRLRVLVSAVMCSWHRPPFPWWEFPGCVLSLLLGEAWLPKACAQPSGQGEGRRGIVKGNLWTRDKCL